MQGYWSVGRTDSLPDRFFTSFIIGFLIATTLRQMYPLTHWWALFTMETGRATLLFAKEESLGDRVNPAV
jgi:hypothetical protein